MSVRNQKLAWILAAMGGLVTLSFNCAPNMFMAANFYSGDNSSLGGTFDKPDSPYVLLSANQQFQSMLNVTGQADAMTSAQKSEYNLRTGALGGNDNIASINGPMMIGATSLAGEVCNGLLAKEKAMASAARTFFKDVDFAKSVADNGAGAFARSAEAMAQNFYGRSLNSEEQQAVTGFYAEFGAAITADGAGQTGALYLSLCAGMLSSFDAMTY